MEGLGESEGKAAIFASQKMSSLCLGGAGMGDPPWGEALEGAGWGHWRLEQLCSGSSVPRPGLALGRVGIGAVCRDWGCVEGAQLSSAPVGAGQGDSVR